MPQREIRNVTVSLKYDREEPEQVAAFHDVKRRYAPELRGKPKEYLYALFLDADNNVLADKLIATGAGDKVAVDVSDIIRTGALTNAQAVILVHNHPSGAVEPSDEDVQATRQVRDALNTADMELLDHVIIGDDAYSFKANDDVQLGVAR
jgi:DNA repair protein RadC